ncbi:lipopolysaccharide biosynthesis protein [Sphingobacterium sp. UBA5996]|uniref:lipopolysaccharide biosynthesis protein n=1 Tax=Sphingobacterium sp. UBA5996 TaxID=1947505 RepID=UPI0025DE36CE|nr:oligosaccharide flippase family protein [Sphingobacterium sp. UBA5996]
MKINSIFKSSLLKSSLIYTFCDAVNKAVPFLILPLLSYYLTPSDYGIIANFNVLLAIVTIFITLGVDGAVSVNYYKFTKDDLARYIFNACLLTSIMTIVIIAIFSLFYHLVYDFVKVPRHYLFLLVLMAFGTTITSINLSLWRLEEKALNFGIYEILQTIVNIGVSLLLVISYHMGWVGRVDGMLVAAMSFGLFSLVLLYRRGYLKIDIDNLYIKDILYFGVPLIPHALSFWIRSGIDRIYITKFIDESATGLYATGFQFGTLVSFLTLSFNNAFTPYLYKSLSTVDEEELNKNKIKLVKITYYGIGILIISCLLFTLCSNFILETFFSSKYIQAKEFVFWAILSQTFQGMYLLFVNYIFFVKRTKTLASITFFCACLQLLLSYFAIKSYGPLGGAYSTVIISFINFIMVAFFSNRVYAMPWLLFLKSRKGK